MELASQKPGVTGYFNHLHQAVVDGFPGKLKSGFFQDVVIPVIEFITMPMPLDDNVLLIKAISQGIGF